PRTRRAAHGLVRMPPRRRRAAHRRFRLRPGRPGGPLRRDPGARGDRPGRAVAGGGMLPAGRGTLGAASRRVPRTAAAPDLRPLARPGAGRAGGAVHLVRRGRITTGAAAATLTRRTARAPRTG